MFNIVNIIVLLRNALGKNPKICNWKAICFYKRALRSRFRILYMCDALKKKKKCVNVIFANAYV